MPSELPRKHIYAIETDGDDWKFFRVGVERDDFTVSTVFVDSKKTLSMPFTSTSSDAEFEEKFRILFKVLKQLIGEFEG